MAKRRGASGGAFREEAARIPAAQRVGAVDAVRGIAILAMIGYHFAYDLRLFGITQSDFENDPFWLAARTAIVSAFLLVAGVSLVLAHQAGVPTERFLRRIAVIAACAIVVSVTSYLAFPRTFIYFGILHGIAASLLIARPLAGKPRLAFAAGIAIIAMGLTLSHPVFDHRWTSWLGFTTFKPPTQDFVPLFPWLGVVLLGIPLGHALIAQGFRPVAGLSRAPRLIHTLGRHSLLVYMLHQPVLIGGLWLITNLIRS